MIRVNLLPQKRSVRATAPQVSQRWLLIVLGVVVLEIILLIVFHQTKKDELVQQSQKNQTLQAKIDEATKTVSNHEEIKKELVKQRARQDAISKLQLGRAGPTQVLIELAQLLTPGRGPTPADPDWLKDNKNPNKFYNPGWDTRRLWLTAYLEDERTVRIEGLARDASDVSELAQRLRLSVYFYEITILPGKKQPDTKTKLELVAFALQLKVRY